MNKYRIRVENEPGYIPDHFVEASVLKEGETCSGFLLMTFDADGRMETYCLHGVSTMSLAQALAGKKNKSGVNIIWQAIAIAEGLRKAADIKFEMDRETESGFKTVGTIKADVPDGKTLLDILLGRKAGKDEDEGEE